MCRRQMVDVGCGIGGSSRYVSRKFGGSARGITLSPVQVGAVAAGPAAVPQLSSGHAHQLPIGRPQHRSPPCLPLCSGMRFLTVPRECPHVRHPDRRGGVTACVQAARANVLAQEAGLADRVSFQVGDALQQPFPDGALPLSASPARSPGTERSRMIWAKPRLSLPAPLPLPQAQHHSRRLARAGHGWRRGAGEFDLTWSMESGEHMPDKAKFVGELCRVTAPGGRIIVVTWCHR